MIDDQRTDHMIRSWIDTGPDRASAEFVERTLAPIPRMRQRRSWRIGLERRVGPLMPLAAAVAVVAVVVGLGLLPKGVPIGGPNPSSSPSPALGSNKPTFELTFGVLGDLFGRRRLQALGCRRRSHDSRSLARCRRRDRLLRIEGDRRRIARRGILGDRCRSRRRRARRRIIACRPT